MKEYLKPIIEDEKIDVEDICAMSSGGDAPGVPGEGDDNSETLPD